MSSIITVKDLKQEGKKNGSLHSH